MRLLIDGYNVMFAAGLLNGRLSPQRFRQARTRFLNHLAAALDPATLTATTIVFDASRPPSQFPAEASHKGIQVLYAVEAEDADSLIEQIIARHSAPRQLTVVSADHRIQQAARRRRAQIETADAFLSRLDDQLARKARKMTVPPPPPPPPPPSPRPSPAESELWAQEFGHLDHDPELREALDETSAMLTQAEIDRIAREVEAEFEL